MDLLERVKMQAKANGKEQRLKRIRSHGRKGENAVDLPVVTQEPVWVLGG